MTEVQKLFDRLNAINPKKQRPMAALTLRFSGKELVHVGQAVSQALDLALANAPEDTTYAGWLMVETKQTARRPRSLKGKTGLEFIKKALATQKTMPTRPESENTKNSGSTAFCLHFQDGGPDSEVPKEFALYFGLVDDGEKTFATHKGFFSLALPLESLENTQTWFLLAENVISTLKAEVAWLSPSLWLPPQHLPNGKHFPGAKDTLISIFGRDPQVDVPHFYASRAPFPAIWNQLQPGPFDGFLSPAWALWADGALAKRVKNFYGNRVTIKDGITRFLLSEKPPFKMTDEIYAEWQKNWQSLSPLHVKYVGDDEKNLKTYFLERFSSPNYSTLETKWRAEFDKEKKQSDQDYQLRYKLTHLMLTPDPKVLFTEIEKMKTEAPIEMLLSFIIPALEDLVKKETTPLEEVTKWLKLADENFDKLKTGHQRVRQLAGVAMELKNSELAMKFLKGVDWKNNLVETADVMKDKRFKPLCEIEDFQNLFPKLDLKKKKS